MKKLLSFGFVLVILSGCHTASGQDQLLDELTITPPSFHNSHYDNLNALLGASIEYPAMARKCGIQGTELIRFAISPSGEIEDITVCNSVSREIDEAVISVLLFTNGKWQPGTIDGEPTTMVREVNIAFVLHSFETMVEKGKNYMLQANNLMYIREKPGRALHFYNKAATLFPNNTSVLLARSLCLEKLGRDAEAEKDNERLKLLAVKGNSITAPHNGAIALDDRLITDLVVMAK